jgi:hypothetical protein
VVGVVRVPRLAGGVYGQLGGDRLSQNDGTRGAEEGDHHGVCDRASARVKLRAVLGGHVGGVEDVLDPHRHTMKRAEEGLAGQQPIAVPCLGERVLGIEEGPGFHARLDAVDPVQAGADQFRGTDLVPPDRLERVGRAECVQVAHAAPRGHRERQVMETGSSDPAGPVDTDIASGRRRQVPCKPLANAARD